MKKNFLNSVVLSLMIINTQHPMNNKKGPRDIIVGHIEGLLLTSNDKKAMKEIGTLGILTSGLTILSAKCQKTKGSAEEIMAQQLFNVLQKVNIKQSQKTYAPLVWRQQTPPTILYEWMLGRKPKELITSAKQEIDKQFSGWFSGGKRSMFTTLSKLTFDPEKNAAVLDKVVQIMCILSALKKNNHRLHLATNWNDKGFQALQKKFPQLFNMFNSITISGNIKRIITPENVCSVLEKAGITLYKPLLLYTEPVKVKNLQTMACSHKNFKEVAQKLEEQGLIDKIEHITKDKK